MIDIPTPSSMNDAQLIKHLRDIVVELDLELDLCADAFRTICGGCIISNTLEDWSPKETTHIAKIAHHWVNRIENRSYEVPNE